MSIRRYLSCVLLLFVCFYVLFSPLHTVYAQSDTFITSFFGEECSFHYTSPYVQLYSYDVSGYTVGMQYQDLYAGYQWLNDETLDITDSEVFFEEGKLRIRYIIAFPEALSKGKIFDFDMRFRIPYDCTVQFNRVNCFNDAWTNLSYDYNSFKQEVYYSDTESTYVYKFSLSDFSCDSGALKHFYLDFVVTPPSDATTFSSKMLALSITEVSSNSLLGNIIQIVKNILTGITNLPKNFANAISGFFDNVVNAVTNLGNFIINGIKGLFIPSEEDITKMKDKWNTLLSDRFGALYQVASLISDYAGAFTEQNKNTITFPSISIPLAGATFEFGGWDVKIVPDGFGIIFDTLKLITSILATVLFVNGLRNRYDKLIGGADDI